MPENEKDLEEQKEEIIDKERISKIEQAIDVIAKNQQTIISQLQRQPQRQPAQQTIKSGLMEDVIMPLVKKELKGDSDMPYKDFFAQVGFMNYQLFNKLMTRRLLRFMKKEKIE